MEMQMEDLYSIHPGISRRCGDPDAALALQGDENKEDQEDEDDDDEEEEEGAEAQEEQARDHYYRYPCHHDLSAERKGEEFGDLKAQIARHPRYPSLLSAYVQCRKVGAPPQTAAMLEEIIRERCATLTLNSSLLTPLIPPDPELDQFMDTYCRVLMRYKEELTRPLDEAASFLSTIQTQLSNLCNTTTSSKLGCTTPATATTSSTDEFAGSSDEDLCLGDADEISELHDPGSGSSSATRLVDNELKEMLLKKYSGYLSHLRKEFLKKRKKGKLPRDARSTLLDWWSTHYRWPYPTEEDKVRLASMTGLDPKQINNWFINQRKRHWKPSEDMRFALMEGVSAGSSGTTTLYFDTGTVGP